MKNYPQHKITNSFLYSHNVAVAAFYFTCKCKWKIELNTLVTGAIQNARKEKKKENKSIYNKKGVRKQKK